MEKIEDVKVNLTRSDIDHALLKDYVKSLKDEDFKKLVTKLKIREEVALKYTSKLERTVKELKVCSKCRSLCECKNEINGCVYYPTVENDRLRFNYVTCKYNPLIFLSFS